MISVGKNAKIKIVWNTKPIDCTEPAKKDIAVRMAKKYGVPVSSIIVEPKFIIENRKGEALNEEVIKNIQDPKFQQKLMKDYIDEYHIEGCDFNEILKIDGQINALMNYDKYEKGKRYNIKWIKWSNFLSYGPDNFFDFTQLHGLVLLKGEPANKSGKSTFAYDLLHFLLFGKTKSGKATNLLQLFNNYLEDEKELKIEGCIEIDGEDYIIRRIVTRSDKSKKNQTASQKLQYYRLLSDGVEEALVDTENVDNCQGESTQKTSKVIKEAIGSEEDFDLIISANAKDLDDLISLKDADRSRLISRWTGLSCLEDKDTLARDKWNHSVSVGRTCDMYNKEELKHEISELETENENYKAYVHEEEGKIKIAEEKINSYNLSRDTMLSSRRPINDALCKVDLTTLNNELERITTEGKNKRAEIAILTQQIESFGNFEYSDNEYRELMAKKDTIVEEIADIKAKISSLRQQNQNLANSEYCPTCKRKFENVDNSGLIKANEETIKQLTENGIKLNKEKESLITKITEIDGIKTKIIEKNRLELKKTALTNNINELLLKYKDKAALKKEREAYTEAISFNNKIDADIRVLDVNINFEKNNITSSNNNIFSYKSNISNNERIITEKKNYIAKITEEEAIEKNWNVYLQLVGKNGICKMVLRESLPIINGELNRLLGDIADFEVEVTVNQKNDVEFWMIRDNIRTRLSGASGLERTQAALALRVVLGKMSNLSKPPFILLDEVLGTVAQENYDDMKKLYDKITSEYSFVLHITHLDLDWHKTVVTVQKIDNISSIKSIINE